jgi:hypothetical protein
MPRDIEIVGISSNVSAVTGPLLPTRMCSPSYKSIAAGSTWSLSTASIINTLTVIPNTTGAATVVLSDGSTAIVSIPAAAHAVSAAPYSINLGGIVATSTLGFKIVTGASVACLVSGSFVGTPTTA